MSEEGGLEEVEESFRAAASCCCSSRTVCCTCSSCCCKRRHPAQFLLALRRLMKKNGTNADSRWPALSEESEAQGLLIQTSHAPVAGYPAVRSCSGWFSGIGRVRKVEG